MRYFFLSIGGVLILFLGSIVFAENPVVQIDTNMGSIEIELYQDKAPITVKNFFKYVDDKFYDGTIFHRIIDDFMIQGGGFTPDMDQKKTYEPIKNEADNGLKNDLYTVAMARTGVVDSATCQFFINVKENTHLNHKDKTPQGYGYAVFGKVVAGTDIVDKIKKVKTNKKNKRSNVPVEPVLIRSIKRK